MLTAAAALTALVLIGKFRYRRPAGMDKLAGTAANAGLVLVSDLRRRRRRERVLSKLTVPVEALPPTTVVGLSVSASGES